MATDNFSGNSNYELQATISRSGSTISVSTIRVRRKEGTGYWTNSDYPWSVEIGSTDWSGNWSYDFTGGVTYQTVTSNRSANKPNGTHNVRVEVAMGSGIGTAVISQNVTVSSEPDAPTGGFVDDITTSSMVYNFTRGASNGSAITANQVQVATNSGFSGATTINLSATNTDVIRTGLDFATTYWFRARTQNGEGWGPWGAVASGTTEAGVPNRPTGGSISLITANSMRYAFTQGTPNGSPVTGNQVQYSTSPTFTGATTVNLSAGVTNYTPTTLQPETTYYFRARTLSAQGPSAWTTATPSGTTLPAGPPGIFVTPSASGTSATVTLTPPSNVSGVTQYEVERRLNGTTTPVTPYTTETNTLSAPGLTPGTTYQWRARAMINTYASPWSSWVTIAQPRPNTSPGDYFDGSTAPPTSADVSYEWTGTVNNSISRAQGVGVAGWSSASGTILQRVTGGFARTYAARMIVKIDVANAWAGISNATAAEVQPGETYYGSIHVKVSRTQRLVARLYWLDSGGSTIGYIDGEAVVVEPGQDWVRLVSTDIAPFGAESAVIRAINVAGTGGSDWLGGDYMDLDAAMITLGNLYPYFDGATNDTAEFAYDWTGTANASTSTRTTLDPGEFDPLQDPDCDPIPQAPRPPEIPQDCIQEIGQWRRYTLTIPAEEVRLWSTTVPTFVLKTGEFDERQVRVRFYENPENLDPSEMDLSVWGAEIIITYIPPRTEVTLDSITQRIWASVRGAAARPATHLLYGTGGAPATWPELSCGISYVVTLDVPTEAPPGNLTTSVMLTQRT